MLTLIMQSLFSYCNKVFVMQIVWIVYIMEKQLYFIFDGLLFCKTDVNLAEVFRDK